MRRIRYLLVAVLAVVFLFGFARPAGAQEAEDPVEEVKHQAEENGGSHADAQCVELLADGGSVDDCHEAPNALIPEVNELIWGAIGFIVVFFFLWKFGVPQMKKAMDERTERIRNDLAAAETQREEADAVLAEYRAQLNDARADAGRIIEEARQAADQVKHDQEQRLQAELAELRTRAIADIETAKSQALGDLRNEVATLAIGAAEVVIQRNLDAPTQTQLVEDYINQVAAQRS